MERLAVFEFHGRDVGMAQTPGVEEGVFEVGQHAVLVQQDDHGNPRSGNRLIVPERLR
ncbi:hypothetical protein D3C71_2244430 [compost metagenome]